MWGELDFIADTDGGRLEVLSSEEPHVLSGGAVLAPGCPCPWLNGLEGGKGFPYSALLRSRRSADDGCPVFCQNVSHVLGQ